MPPTVLVVDDNEDIRQLLRSLFSLSGYEVVLAAGGRQALTLLTDDALAPDVTILDLEMPDVSGWDVLRAIRTDPVTSDLAVIVCTVRDGADDLDQGRSLRCDGYVQKPFAVDDLMAEVGGVLAGRA